MKLFLSYRRDDSAHASDRIYEHLKDQRFDVIYDIDTTPMGRDYREYLRAEVVACDVMIVVIGDNWLEVKNDKGHRRIDDPEDWVHIEIKAALEREIPVIPVLVGRRKPMPTASELPSALVGLAYRQAAQARPGPLFNAQLELLVEEIKRSQQVVQISERNPEVSSEILGREWWQELTVSAAQLYPQGPLDRQIWTRASGDVGELELSPVGKTAWFAALRMLELGGGGISICARKLLETMMEDFPANEKLKRLYTSLP